MRGCRQAEPRAGGGDERQHRQALDWAGLEGRHKDAGPFNEVLRSRGRVCLHEQICPSGRLVGRPCGGRTGAGQDAGLKFMHRSRTSRPRPRHERPWESGGCEHRERREAATASGLLPRLPAATGTPQPLVWSRPDVCLPGWRHALTAAAEASSCPATRSISTRNSAWQSAGAQKTPVVGVSASGCINEEFSESGVFRGGKRNQACSRKESQVGEARMGSLLGQDELRSSTSQYTAESEVRGSGGRVGEGRRGRRG